MRYGDFLRAFRGGGLRWRGSGVCVGGGRRKYILVGSAAAPCGRRPRTCIPRPPPNGPNRRRKTLWRPAESSPLSVSQEHRSPLEGEPVKQGRSPQLNWWGVRVGVCLWLVLAGAVHGQEREVVEASRGFAMGGDYGEAIAVCEEAIGGDSDDDYADKPLISTQLAEVKRVIGESAGAVDILEAVVEGNLEPPVRSLVQYGALLQFVGRKEEAGLYLQAARRRYDDGLAYSSSDVTMVALASQLLGDFHDANALFDEALRIDPDNLEAHTLWADLFQEKYNPADAERGYRDALEIDSRYVPALVGLAEVLGEIAAARRALSVNPRSAAALQVYGQLLLRDSRPQAARLQLERALEQNPEALEALAILAAEARLQGRDEEYEAHLQRAAAVSPGYIPAHPGLLSDVAEILGRNYRFDEAVEAARAALQADPEYWRAYAILGGNLLRLGREEEGRRYLETGFDRDPFNVLSSNLLTVFDTLDGYRRLESGPFQVVMSERDAAILWPYMEPLLQEAWDTLSRKYGFEPEAPVLIEMFERSDDFAVRSIGLPDIGPLVGICFGKVITLISPDTLSANWQEIVWHEFAHVITLQMTANRIPRWLSEGVSMWEEKQARPYWGRQQGLDLVRALQQERLLPVAGLNAAFSDAKNSADLGFAYFQSYLVVDYIAEEFGFDSLRDLILEYAPANADKTDEARFETVFAMDLSAFDAGFRGWASRRGAEIDVYVHNEDLPDEGDGHGHGIRQNPSAILAELYNNAALIRHMRARVEAEPRDFQAHLQLGIVLFKESRYEEAAAHLQTAYRLLPGYTGYPSPPLVLSQIYEAEGEREAQLEQLRLLLENQQHDFDSALMLAFAALEAEDYDEADYYIDRALQVDPYRSQVHRLRATLAEAVGDHGAAVTEYEVLLQLDTTDPVDARTDLAEAYLQAGRPAEAKQQILHALETAPSYRRAQRLLLQALAANED